MNSSKAAVVAIKPSVDATDLLEGYTFADALSTVTPVTLTAADAARYAFGQAPTVAKALMRLRNRIVGLLGLKAAGDFTASTNSIGGFPIVSETPERVVLGFDDSHLDFRIVIDSTPMTSHETRITVATIVRTHNLVGRAYMAMILPFHKLISRNFIGKIPRHPER